MPDRPANRAVFLDRDGTIVKDLVYSADPALLEPLPGVFVALKKLREAGYRLIVITNQSGIARGIFTEAALNQLHEIMLKLFRKNGVEIDGVYYCPHYPTGKVERYMRVCDCRKPAPGMILKAAAEHDIDLARSWMVGDRAADIGAGRAAGCRTIAVLTGDNPPQDEDEPDFTVADMSEAATAILGHSPQ